MQTYLTIGCSEYIVHYSYCVTSPGAPERGPSYASGGQPAEPMEFETVFTGLSKDDGSGKETPVECPDWLKAEIEFWMYEDAKTYDRIYMDIEKEEGDKWAEAMDRRDEAREDRLMWWKDE
jgi:hypothetical protein